MSVIGHSLLNEIVNKGKALDPHQVLEKLDEEVILSLKQESTSNDDGMDVCLCKIQQMGDGARKVFFTGAKRPLFYVRKDSDRVYTLKGDIRSIGGLKRKSKAFTTQEILLNEGDTIYLTTDGFTDQGDYGGEKLGTPKLKKILSEIHSLPMPQQQEALEKELLDHQQTAIQRDDITLIGIRL